jgi:hypothetical protein
MFKIAILSLSKQPTIFCRVLFTVVKTLRLLTVCSHSSLLVVSVPYKLTPLVIFPPIFKFISGEFLTFKFPASLYFCLRLAWLSQVSTSPRLTTTTCRFDSLQPRVICIDSKSVVNRQLLTKASTMAYHIYGDSNIVRYLSAMKSRSADPQYQTITYTKTTNMVLLRDSLSKPDVSHPIIVVSALTNLLTAKFFNNYELMIGHCRSTFADLQTWIQEGRDAVDGFAQQVRFFYCQPIPSCGILQPSLRDHLIGLTSIYFAYRS